MHAMAYHALYGDFSGLMWSLLRQGDRRVILSRQVMRIMLSHAPYGLYSGMARLFLPRAQPRHGGGRRRVVALHAGGIMHIYRDSMHCMVFSVGLCGYFSSKMYLPTICATTAEPAEITLSFHGINHTVHAIT